MNKPLFTAADVELLRCVVADNEVSDEDVRYKERYRQQRILADTASDLANRLQQWIDQDAIKLAFEIAGDTGDFSEWNRLIGVPDKVLDDTDLSEG